MRNRHLTVLVSIIGLITACGSKDSGVDGTNGGLGGAGASNNNGGAGNMANGTGTAGDATDVGGTGSDVGAGSTDGGTSSDGNTGGALNIGGDGCTQQAGISGPAVIEFTIDNTESMSSVTTSTNGASKMARTREAFQAEIPNFPDAFAIGLTYYHVNSGPCNDATQAVEIAQLGSGNTAQRQALTQSITTQRQIQMTPSSDAWLFAASQVLGWVAPADFANASRYVVVMTDGVPTVADNCADSQGCDLGISEAQYQLYIANVAAVYQNNGLKTFFIGVPGSEDTSQVTCNGTVQYDPRTKLSELAIAGGTAPAGCSTTSAPYCHIDLTDPNINFQVELQKAIQTVVASAKSCQYSVDPAIASNPNVYVDPTTTSVMYTPAGGAVTSVPMSMDCADPGGWHYTNGNNTMLELCPALCEAYQASTDDVIEVHFDCVKIG